MTSHQRKKPGCVRSNLLRIAWGVPAACALLLPGPVAAAEYAVSGESTTFLRMNTTVGKRDIYPLYEYLRLSVSVEEKDGSATSLRVGGWGRIDLGQRSTRDNADGDLQYGYISHQGAKNNLLLNAGRQFVVEGVAAERIDGLYLRNDFAAGFTGAAFIGSPVTTEPNFAGGDLVYGARVAQGRQGLYSVGLSALKSDGPNDSRDREEQGLDLWLHPVKQVDLTGRSTYNSLSGGWMEHAYGISLAPLDALTVGVDFSRINYDDYFYHVTTSALSLTNGLILPTEELTTAGIRAAYSPIKTLTVSADYKKYSYRIAGDADYFGGNLSYAPSDSLGAGLGAHRMEGASDRLRYSEYRLYVLKKLGAVDLAADLFGVDYDREISGVGSSFALTGSAGYRFNEKLRVWADLEYSRSPDFDNEVRGLVKLAYAFDMKRSEGGGKSEK